MSHDTSIITSFYCIDFSTYAEINASNIKFTA